MKKLLKVWMYLCTILVTAQLLLGLVLAVWTQFQEKKSTYTLSSGEKIYISEKGDTTLEFLKFFEAIENNDLETIYRYAAPELKEKISYELFVQDQWPDAATEDIKVLFEKRNSMEGSETEHILQILLFKENGMKRYGAMRWERTAGSFYYNTIPFKITYLSEFGSFPTHITN